MNDRIKELADQATDKEHGYSFFDREKFAELIVRECANRLGELGNPELGNGIKQYFGVE